MAYLSAARFTQDVLEKRPLNECTAYLNNELYHVN